MVGIIWLVCREVCDLVFFVECVFVLFIVWVSVKLYLSNLGEIKLNEKFYEIIIVYWYLLFYI